MINLASVEFSEEEIEVASEVFRSGMVREGKKTAEFEQEFCEKYGCDRAVAVSSGTAALHLTYLALCREFPDKTEVITTPFSFIATSNTLLLTGLTPVYVDIDPRTFNLDASRVEEKITDRTLAIAPVNLFGLPCDYDSLRVIADQHDVALVNDSAQAIHAEYGGVSTANLPDFNCFSFYATKNLAIGEGGMISGDHELIETMRLIKRQGQSSKYTFTEIGMNYRPTDVLSAVGTIRLHKIDHWTEIRRRNANLLTEGLRDIPGLTPPHEPDNVKHCYHQYSVLLDEDKLGMTRKQFMAALNEAGVGSAIIYPEIIPRQPLYQNEFGYEEGTYPVAEETSRKILSIPVHQDLSEDHIQTILSSVEKIVGAKI